MYGNLLGLYWAHQILDSLHAQLWVHERLCLLERRGSLAWRQEHLSPSGSWGAERAVVCLRAPSTPGLVRRLSGIPFCLPAEPVASGRGSLQEQPRRLLLPCLLSQDSSLSYPGSTSAISTAEAAPCSWRLPGHCQLDQRRGQRW